MPPSIGMACNIYNECNAVHGLLETASQYFDEMVFYHTGPDGVYSNDGTIEILEKWGVRLEFGNINEGFGKVRTDLVRKCSTEWVMIMDADERFYPVVPRLSCHGSEVYPKHENPKLEVGDQGSFLNQGAIMKDLISNDQFDVIRTCRRHWFDHSWTRPTQNWWEIADWQSRVIRNNGAIGYNVGHRMHEGLVGGSRAWHGNATHDGPYHDHFHCFYKPMEPEQRKQDIMIYDRLSTDEIDMTDVHAAIAAEQQSKVSEPDQEAHQAP